MAKSYGSANVNAICIEKVVNMAETVASLGRSQTLVAFDVEHPPELVAALSGMKPPALRQYGRVPVIGVSMAGKVIDMRVVVPEDLIRVPELSICLNPPRCWQRCRLIELPWAEFRLLTLLAQFYPEPAENEYLETNLGKASSNAEPPVEDTTGGLRPKLPGLTTISYNIFRADVVEWQTRQP